MSRKIARENALKLIYEFCIINGQNELTLKNLSSADEMSAEDSDYLTIIYNGINEKYDELSVIIDNLSKGFALDRLYKIDLSILLIAIYEIKYMKDIPTTVSINEAVELSKIYSTEKSSSFINGILATYIRGESL